MCGVAAGMAVGMAVILVYSITGGMMAEFAEYAAFLLWAHGLTD